MNAGKMRKGLEQYKGKRDFARTPEPRGGPLPGGTGGIFVVQKHAASRLHYDFRLEMNGVLKSWAVPKGPSLDPEVKRLAVHVEDHPVDYAEFEGVIPEGQYGGGTVMVWDKGTWSPVGGEKDFYNKDSLKLKLDGKKLKGRWALVKMKKVSESEGKDEWILFKEKDEHARPGSKDAVLKELPKSALTGRDMDGIAALEGVKKKARAAS